MLLSTTFALAGLLVLEASASVRIRKTGRPPTGYEVDFRYVNATAKRVLIGGGIQPFTDQFHATGTSYRFNGRYDPHEYQPGDFYVSNPSPQLPAEPAYKWPYEMKKVSDDGVWTYTAPLPSGIYSFAYLVDCNYAPNCTIDTGHLVIDPDLPPFMNVPGDQVASSFQVPFDARFQASPELNTNFDYALDAPKKHRGRVFTVNYTSPGSLHPAPDIHDFSIYLPAEYGKVPGKKYPLLYLSHGAGGNGADWENLGRMSHIMDNLIREGHIPPTVVVTPSFYNLDPSLGPRFIYGNRSNPVPVPPAAKVRENFERYLFPWVESHYDVCQNASCRAFAGLSMGGVLTYEMYVNATEQFEYYGLFSPATNPPYIDAAAVREKPALLSKGLMVAYGLYDFVFPQARDLQTALDAVGLRYINRVTPFGSHYWNTWQDELWWFGVKVLWKPLPFDVRTGR
ncbi:carbohydrate esterase family 1 protein [Canariomyces notabilis]|uniref:Carbohydrate esterase family 1 protein n=1 Tax=Canariomyces notabilis TaxID=2074819 RepID=A0AAN6TCE2_9PEZI|nr:carbohydrate esterase family 1 protein [Canariomyces arenarius]